MCRRILQNPICSHYHFYEIKKSLNRSLNSSVTTSYSTQILITFRIAYFPNERNPTKIISIINLNTFSSPNIPTPVTTPCSKNPQLILRICDYPSPFVSATCISFSSRNRLFPRNNVKNQ